MIDFKLPLKRSTGGKKIGLDLGSHTIKALAVSSIPKLSLLSFGLKDISGLSSEDIVNSIRELIDEMKVPAKEVILSVSGQPVTVRFITMPNMSEEDLKGAVRFEAEKFIPFDINDCMVDSYILKKDEKEGKLHILLVAAKKTHIKSKIRLVEEAGFSVSLVDVDSFALTNSFLSNFPVYEKDKTVALLNIGSMYTNLSIIRNGALSFVRDVAVGGKDFDAAIAKALGISNDEAEKIKISPGSRKEELLTVTKNVATALLDDIKLSFNYHENQSGGGIDEIYISGGSSQLFGLEESFNELFGIKPKQWNPLQFLDMTSSGVAPEVDDKTSHFFAIASGLVMR